MSEFSTVKQDLSLNKAPPPESDYSATRFRPADITDVVTNELVLICVTSYLTVPSLLSLSSASRGIRSAMHTTPGAWRTIDLSDLIRIPSSPSLLKFLRQPYVIRDCRRLILDGFPFDHDLLGQILLGELPAIHTISLKYCPYLNGDHLIKLIDYIRRPSAPRPLSLRRVLLLGAPLFPYNQASSYAPIIVKAAGTEIETDLAQCSGKDHLDIDSREGKWRLKVEYPNHPCALCQVPQNVCMKCHLKKSCVGCHSFFCDDCEPYPRVSPPFPP
jgi:hypothetical protein